MWGGGRRRDARISRRLLLCRSITIKNLNVWQTFGLVVEKMHLKHLVDLISHFKHRWNLKP